MVMTKDQARRLRVATGIRLIKKMTPEEINQTFERQFNEIEELQAENAKLQQELKYSDEDLIATQKSLSKLETEFESISLVFCDSEGDPDFEPFNAENLSIWLKRFGIKQQAKGVEDYGNLTLFPSMGDGFSGDFCSGFEATLSHALTVAKQLRQQAKGE